jgi:hypothetical protein
MMLAVRKKAMSSSPSSSASSFGWSVGMLMKLIVSMHGAPPQ